MHAQADAAHVDNPDTRKSTASYLVYHGTNLISCKSHTIKTVVTSTCKAEYMGASNAARHISWTRRLLAELTEEPARQVPLAMDNTGSLAVAANSAPTKRSKYIDIRHHLLRDYTARRIVAPFFTASAQLQADIMTKPLRPALFITHRRKLRIRSAQNATITSDSR
eukprot:IDg22964t1